MTQRTITRWETYGELPPPAPARGTSVSADAAKAALDTAVAVMAEDLDVGPRKLRTSLVELFRHVSETGLPVDAVRLLIAGPRSGGRAP